VPGTGPRRQVPSLASHAVPGGLVAGVTYNGLELLDLSADGQLMRTALALVGAVTSGALARRGRTAS
jgi:hypothetical protein